MGADPHPIHEVTGIHGSSVTRDQHAGNGADIAVASPADALEACSMESGRLGIKSPSHREPQTLAPDMDASREDTDNSKPDHTAHNNNGVDCRIHCLWKSSSEARSCRLSSLPSRLSQPSRSVHVRTCRHRGWKRKSESPAPVVASHRHVYHSITTSSVASNNR